MELIVKLATASLSHTNLLIPTINSIFSILGYIQNGYPDDFKILELMKEIKLMDLEIKLRLLHAIIEKRQDKIDSIEKIYSEKLQELLTEIEGVLFIIQEKIRNHKLKWFHHWRSFTFTTELEELRKLDIILEKRIHLGNSFKII